MLSNARPRARTNIGPLTQLRSPFPCLSFAMDRYWLITWTAYGTWLAGDERGFVSNVYSDDGGPEVRHNSPATDCDSSVPGLEMYVRDRMLDDPFHLNEQQAVALVNQFQETSRIRKYELCTASIMYNHMHLLVGVPGDPD